MYTSLIFYEVTLAPNLASHLILCLYVCVCTYLGVYEPPEGRHTLLIYPRITLPFSLACLTSCLYQALGNTCNYIHVHGTCNYMHTEVSILIRVGVINSGMPLSFEAQVFSLGIMYLQFSGIW